MPPHPGRRAVTAGLLALPGLARAQAEAWPNRPIRLIYPFAPGAGDLVPRLIGEQLQPMLGQSLVIEHRPGANTMIGAEAAARSPKDGYTLGWVATSTLVMNPNLYPNITYGLGDFAPLCLAYRAPVSFAVSATLPIRTVAEALEHIRRNPGIGFGSVGNGSSPHVTMEMMMGLTGVRLESVAYRGEQAIITDLMTGRIPFYAGSTNSLLPHLEGGKFRILAISSPRRLPVLPDVPTFREAVHPDLELRYWHGVVAPAGVPAPILTRLANSFAEILRMDAVRERLPPDMEVEPVILEDFATLIREEQARYGRIIRERNITVL
ncbi:Bug family tripartite tricarboxylate transporter substrate binding protein [Belnapia rosea]|uniref:Tripartite-type tricarboxylate transporter, receptor component TctC n=1 Tax=Belnapia rosea TaxID=938405 RepID=A0A1G6T0Z7_9PROT|nr:tripartite tricarboxylate transporter substrate binding protein [Belnapia rosea]SDD22524.1 Tripartite-type tricarboxylate transporter, receptor component TctC [Belnapia rosea]